MFAAFKVPYKYMKVKKIALENLDVLLVFAALLLPFKVLSLLMLPVVFLRNWPLVVGASKVYNYVFYLVFSSLLFLPWALLARMFEAKLSTLLLVTLNVLFVFLIKKIYKTSEKTDHFKNIHTSDFFSILLGLIFCCFIVFTTFSSGYKTGLIRELSTGFDNTQHIVLTKALYDQKEIVYGSSESTTPKLVYSDRGEYPKAWHLIASIYWSSVDQDLQSSNPYKLLSFFYFTKIAMLFIMIYFISRGALLAAENYLRIKPNISTYFTVLLGVGFLLVTYYTSNVYSGFAPFMLTIILAIIASMHLLIEFKNRYFNLLVASVILLVGVFSWLLSALFFGPYFLYFLYKNYLESGNVIKFIKSYKLLTIPLIVASASVLQLYFQLKYSVKPNNINEEGGIISLSSWYILLLSALPIFYFAYAKKQSLSKIAVITFSIGSLLPAFIYMYQMLSANHVSYFYFKSLGMIVSSMSIIFLVSLVYSANTVVQKFGNIALFFVVSILASSIFLFNIDISQTRYILGGNRELSIDAAKKIESHMDRIITEKPYIVVNTTNNPSHELKATILLNSLTNRHDLCQQNIIGRMLNFPNNPKIDDFFIECEKQHPILIIK